MVVEATELVLEPTSDRHTLEVTSKDGKAHFLVSDSGCVEITLYMNESIRGNVVDLSDVDFIHICNFGEFQEMLKRLQQMSERYFDGWPE
jgi:hypothetical protein